MIVAFDGAGLGDGPVTGVGRAFLHALRAYAARGDAECLLLLPPGALDPMLQKVRVVAAPRGALRRQLGLPGLLRHLRADVLHSSVAAVPLRAPCPTIATAHDLPWLHPESGEAPGLWHRLATTASLRAATAVLAPSAFTAADVVRVRGPHRSAPLVVPHGVPAPAPPCPDPAERRGPFLVLGADRPRKNRTRLQQAVAIATRSAADLPPVQFQGPPDAFVDEDEKARLLRGCRAVVHVSRFEGYGMPVLEGLAHGAPVLASSLPPHREIAGDAALFVDADDAEAIAAGLVRIHRDEALRRQLVRAGLERARLREPQHTAAAWAALHRELQR